MQSNNRIMRSKRAAVAKKALPIGVVSAMAALAFFVVGDWFVFRRSPTSASVLEADVKLLLQGGSGSNAESSSSSAAAVVAEDTRNGILVPAGQDTTCPTANFAPRQPQEEAAFLKKWRAAVKFARRRKLTFLYEPELEMHRNWLAEIETNGVPGMIVECGVAKAGSSVTFAAIKHPKRCLHLHDTFQGMPEPTDKDGPDVQYRYQQILKNKEACRLGQKQCKKGYYGNMDNLLDYDIKQFQAARLDPQDNAVFFHKGLFDDTVFPKQPIAYAHLDGDWYVSVLNMLKRIDPYLAVGGYIVLDDAFHYSGAKTAVEEFFQVDVAAMDTSLPANGMCRAARKGGDDSDSPTYGLGIKAPNGKKALQKVFAKRLDANQWSNLQACPPKAVVADAGSEQQA